MLESAKKCNLCPFFLLSRIKALSLQKICDMKFKEIIGIRQEERWPAALFMLVALVLNIIFVDRQNCYLLSVERWQTDMVELLRQFHISGYDPYAVFSLCQWDVIYNPYRHPLIALLLWPLSQLNAGVEWLTGMNAAAVIMAILVMVNALYGMLFFRRILREVIGLGQTDTHLLTALFYAMAYILLMLFVPDHFTFSMTLLLLTAWLAGRYMQKRRKWWNVAPLFFFVTGLTLTNSIKVGLAALFVKGWRCLRPRYLFLVFLLPLALLLGMAHYQFKVFSIPRAEIMAKKEAVRKATIETLRLKRKGIDKIVKPEKPKEVKKQVDFLSWTDTETSRTKSLTENVFGESIQLHQRYTLMDGLGRRPLFVEYDWMLNYIVEGMLIVLFLGGIICGWKERFCWMLLTWMACDATLHLGLGFGLNEAYLMAPHWLFILPLSMGWLLQRFPSWFLRVPILALALFLFIYNQYLLIPFLLTN